jgi:molybdate transport system regulatory protein
MVAGNIRNIYSLWLKRWSALRHHAPPWPSGWDLTFKEIHMSISARNVFRGQVTALKEGPINAEVEITTTGGDKIVATVTEGSVKSLGLAVGAQAVAVVKTMWVTLLAGTPEFRFSARNQLSGTVSSMVKGPVNCQVSVTLPGGAMVSAMITNAAAVDLALAEGTPVVALFKASHVLVGVPV